MAGVINVRANKGKSDKNECNDPKMNAMALKMKPNYQKTASASAKQKSTSPAYRASRSIILNFAPISQINNQENLFKDREDIPSILGLFGWKEIASYYIPYIFREISGEKLKFVSVRMVETQLLSNHFHYLHANIYTCTSVKSHFITYPEANILNKINNDNDDIYGKDKFYAGKDYIVRLEDALEFYTFIEICYNKVLNNIIPGRIEKCGFISVNLTFVVPYCLIDGRKYLPVFYFEGETESLMQRSIKVEDWNLAYLKFVCKVQGINNELYTTDSCSVTDLDDIKKLFPPETDFVDYWPAKIVDNHHLINQNPTHIHPSGVWVRPPLESTIPHSLTASAPVMPQSTPVVMNTFQNRCPPNKLVNSCTTPVLHPQTTCGYSISSRNQSIAPECYNTGSHIMSQSNNLMNGGSHVIPPPPLDRANNTASTVSYTVSHSNPVPISQCMTTMYNPVPSSSVNSHSNQMERFYNQHPSNNSQGQQQQVQQHQQQLQPKQQHQQPQQQHQQIITTPQVQPYSGSKSVQGHLTNTQQRNTLRNVAPVSITPAIDIIDLSSPPSSPAPTPLQDAPLRPKIELKLKIIPELTWEVDSTNNAPYKIQRATINRKMIHCINANPYIYEYLDLMVTLEDLIHIQLLSCTIPRCAYVLYKYLNITLFRGNSEQLKVLQENRRFKLIYAKYTPMVMLQDITRALPELKNMLSKKDQQLQSAAGPSKRHRTN